MDTCKMERKLVLIFIGYVFLFIAGTVSCNIHDCGPISNRLKTVGLDWFNYKASYSDDPGKRLILTEIVNDSVDYHQYSIYINPRQETYFSQSSNRRTFSLVKTAYACSPVEPKTDEKIESIVITSAKDFDADHPSGSDLSDLYDIVVVDPSKSIYDKKYSLTEYIKSNPFVPTELTLILRGKPQLTTDFEFLIKLYLDGVDNDYFEFSTNSIVIRND